MWKILITTTPKAAGVTYVDTTVVEFESHRDSVAALHNINSKENPAKTFVQQSAIPLYSLG